jgi:signal transduction histidine kinase/GGDEF domain-containing protein
MILQARFKHMLFGAAAVALLTVLFIKTQGVQVKRHTRITAALYELERLEAACNEQLLKLRFGLLHHYDPLTQTLDRLRAVLYTELKPNLVSLYRHRNLQTIDRHLEATERQLVRKERLIEEFQSQNTTLNNSVRYFPMATARLLEAVRGRGQESLALSLSQLMRMVLLYNLTADEDMAWDIRALLDRLASAQSPDADVAEQMRLVMAHTQIILNQKPEVDQMVAELVSERGTESLNVLHEAYTVFHESQLRQTDVYRVGLYSFSVLLVGYIAAILLKLRRNIRLLEEHRRQLAQVNEDLEESKASLEQQAQTLEVANTELKRLSALKDELVANVSHELRTPLTAMKEGISLLMDRALGEITIEQRDFLGTMAEGADRLAELIGNLLDLSKIEAGKLQLVRRRVNVRSLIEQLTAQHQAMIKQRAVSLDAEPVPDVYADPHRILQVLANFFSNALKFTKADGRITFRLRQEDGVVVTSVQDNGVGIHQEDVSKLFQKFSQVGETRPQGTGLGLALCKELVELHQGTVAVTSEPGLGTTFTFTLPIYTPAFVLEDSFRRALAAAERARDGTVAVIVFDAEPVVRRWPSSDQGHTPEQQLEVLAEELRGHVHRGDCVVSIEPRWIVVLAVADETGAQAIMQRLHDRLEERMTSRRDSDRPPICAGMALYPRDGDQVHALFAKATAAPVRQSEVNGHV